MRRKENEKKNTFDGFGIRNADRHDRMYRIK